MNLLFEDLRRAVDSFRKHAGFFFTALLTMILGVGAAKAILTITSISVFV